MTTNTAIEVIEFIAKVSNGPSATRIVDAFRYAYDSISPLLATFTLDKGEKINLRETSIEHEDGSGNSFIVIGYVMSVVKEFLGTEIRVNNPNLKIKLFYNAITHNGSATFDSLEDMNTCRSMTVIR